MKFIAQFVAIIALISICHGADWPMWRYDANRSANSAEILPNDLAVLWTRQFTPREPVWDDPLNQDLMQFDRIFEPIVLGKNLYVGFNDRDKVVAFDVDSGEQKWAYYTEGPVRLPLVGWHDKIYFNSDDGYLYCLSAEKGELIWRFRGGPNDLKLLGNKRLISMWPARGGAVIKDGIVYFSASIWPWMGTFIYALEAESGILLWENDDTNADYIMQPHNFTAYAGIAPQGTFAISGDRLLIPGGRSVPACFDRKTGEQLYFHLTKYNQTGGAFVCANEDIFFNHHRDRVVHLYNLSDGKLISRGLGKYPVLGNNYYYFSGKTITARSVDNPDKLVWEAPVNATGDLIKAGSVLYAGGVNQISAVQISEEEDAPKILWQKEVNGKVERLIAADGKLFAVTFAGEIIAFGNKNQQTRVYPNNITKWQPSVKDLAQANAILDEAGIRDGYAIVYGAGDGNLLAALVQQSNLDIFAVEKNAQKIDKLRRRFDEMEIYGKRLSLIQGTLQSVQLSEYFASLTILWDVDYEKTSCFHATL